MGRRIILLVAAVLFAAVGTGVLFVYVKSTTGSGGGSGATTAVLAPRATIAAGTPIANAEQFTSVEVDSRAVEQGQFVTDFGAIKGLVANRELEALVPVARGQFGGVVRQPTNLAVAEGKMALTVEVEDPNRVSTFLVGGQDVAVFVVDPDSRDQERQKHKVKLLLPKVTVLTTGSSGTIRTEDAPTNGGSRNSARGTQSLVTFEVTPQEAGTILVAQAAGELYLGLLGPGAPPGEQDFDQTVIGDPAGTPQGTGGG